MAGDEARGSDPRFPNPGPDVVDGYLGAPSTRVAEVINGELSLMPRPRPRHARAEPFDAVELSLGPLWSL